MKKSTLIISLISITSFAFSQAKKDTVKQKLLYEKFIKVSVNDYRQLVGIAEDYKSQVKYNALMKADEKINLQINLEKYLFDLPKSVKLDSTLKK